MHLIKLTLINFKDLSRSAETCPFHFKLLYYISYLCFRNAANECGSCLNMYLHTWKELKHVNTQEVLRGWVVDGAFVWTQLSRWKILSQALKITATYEGRIKCKKMIAIYPHSPIRMHSWRIKCAVPLFPQWLGQMPPCPPSQNDCSHLFIYKTDWPHLVQTRNYIYWRIKGLHCLMTFTWTMDK